MRQKLKRSLPTLWKSANAAFHHAVVDSLKDLVLDHFPLTGDVVEITFKPTSPFGEIEKRFKARSIGTREVRIGPAQKRITCTKLELSLLPYDYRTAEVYWRASAGIIYFLKLDGAVYDISLRVRHRGKKHRTAGKISKEIPDQPVVQHQKRLAA